MARYDRGGLTPYTAANAYPTPRVFFYFIPPLVRTNIFFTTATINKVIVGHFTYDNWNSDVDTGG
jgi:hypothetical protein